MPRSFHKRSVNTSCVVVVMGIKFHCQDCDKKLHVKAYLAGKRGICPHCGAKVRIPATSQVPAQDGTGVETHHRESADVRAVAGGGSAVAPSRHSAASSADQDAATSSTSVASPDADPTREDPEAVWYVRPPSGGQYGPADGEIMRRWLEEGRVSADSLVWREGWNDWRTGDSIFPSLREVLSPTDPLATSAMLDQSQPEAFALEESGMASPAARTRPPSSSKFRNVSIVVALSLVCVGLLIALLLVLQNHG